MKTNRNWLGMLDMKLKRVFSVMVLAFVPLTLFAEIGRVAELKNQLTTIEAAKKQELAAVDQSLDKAVRQLTAEIETLKTSIPDTQQQLDTLKEKNAPLRNQLDKLQQERATIEKSYADKIAQAEKSITEAQEAAKRLKTESLAAAAKLINDAIIANNLKIDLVPKDGIYEASQQSEENEMLGVGTVFERQVIQWPGRKENKDGDLVDVNTMPEPKHLSQGFGLKIISHVDTSKSSFGQYLVLITTYQRFPTALANTDVFRNFREAYRAHVKQLAEYKQRTDPPIVASLQEESRLALQKWGFQNGETVKSLETQYAPVAAQIKSLSTKLSEDSATLAAKQAIQAKPRDSQLVEMRNVVEKKYEEQKKPVLADLAAAEVRLLRARKERREEIYGNVGVCAVIALIITVTVLAYGLFTKCPSCKRSFAAKVEREVVTGKDEEYREETQVTRHYDSGGKEVGSSHTPVQRRYIVTYYDQYKFCRYCDHKWMVHKSGSQKG